MIAAEVLDCVRMVEILIGRVRVAKKCPPAIARAIAELNGVCAQAEAARR